MAIMDTIGAAMKGKLSKKDKKKMDERAIEDAKTGAERAKREPDALQNDVKRAVSPFSYLFDTTKKKKPAK